MKLTADSLNTHLGQQLLPAYLVSGDEPLLAAEAADAVRASARAAGFSEREVHFIERNADWDAVRASAANLSLFGARRVLEIRLSSARPGVTGNATLVALLEAADPDTLLLILTPRLDREAQGADWVRALEAHGAWVQVWPVEAGRLIAWLKTRCRRVGLEASEEALELIASRTEGNLLAAHQELCKLALLAGGAAASSGTVSTVSPDAASPGAASPGPRVPVTLDGVLASVADSARFDVFRLSDAVLAGDAVHALRMLAGLRAEGVEATLVLWALVKAMREVWSAHSSGGRPPAWQRQSAALARALKRAPRLSFAALAQRATRADRIIKGRLPGEAWDELALLATELCGEALLARPAA